MRPVLPFDEFPFDQPEIRLIDEDRCLEALARALSRHAALRDLVELPVDEWNQLLEGTLVAPLPFEKEPGDSGMPHLRSFSTLTFRGCFSALEIRKEHQC
jgi:hypothetical protein